MVTAEDVRRVASTLPRSSEHLIRDRVKFRVGRIVYAAISPDETSMGFAFPKEERADFVAANPDTFRMPVPSDLRYNWVRCWLDAAGPGRDAGADHRRLDVVRTEVRRRRVLPGTRNSRPVTR